MPITAFELSITLRAPFLTQSSVPGEYGLDVLFARDDKKRLYLPGTSVTGVLRKAWLALTSVSNANTHFKPNIDSWLGKSSEVNRGDGDAQKGTVLPFPKRLFIEDLHLLPRTDAMRQKPSFRIRMDNERGVVEQGAYIVTERPFLSGEKITFEGIARFLAQNDQEVTDLKKALTIGLQWLIQIGANRTIGFGEVIQVKVAPSQIKSVLTQRVTVDEETTKYALRICPQQPFCFTEHQRRIKNNLLSSSGIIPGGALKGAIANMWIALVDKEGNKRVVDENLDKTRPELGQYFEALRITHAFPSSCQTQRPVTYPKSLVKVDKQVYDVALCEGPILIEDIKAEKPGTLSALAFDVDWKNSGDVSSDFGWPDDVKHELRIRTAIDAETRHAKDQQLFAYEMVVPEKDLAWYAQLDLSAIKTKADRQRVIDQLHSLLNYGVTGLGVTKAYTHIELLPEKQVQPPTKHHSQTTDKKVWIVTLQTPALLCNPHGLNQVQVDKSSANQAKQPKSTFLGRVWKKSSFQPPPALNPAEQLRQTYADAWANLSANTLKLERFFATQTLTGGFYLWKRFQAENLYQPYLLTDAGSVFVLSTETDKEAEAKTYIKQWLETGLPLPQWAIEEYGLGEQPESYWKNCPYIPQNGYGEIAVNLPVHWEKHPEKQGVKFESIPQEGLV
jgi:hypothetical protein